MAKGKLSTVKVILNNNKATTTTTVHEQVVVNGVLVDYHNKVNPGVFSV